MKLTGRTVHLSGMVNSSKCDFLDPVVNVAMHQIFADERTNYGYVILSMGAFPQVTNFNSVSLKANENYSEPYALLTIPKRDFTTFRSLEIKEMSLAQNNQCLAVYDTLYNQSQIKPNRVITRDLSLAFFPDTETLYCNYFVELAEVQLSDMEEITQILKDNAQTVEDRDESQGFYNPDPTSTGGV